MTDSVTSDGLTVFIENKLGMQCLLYGAFFIYFFICLSILFLGKHHRFKRGYKNVIDEAIRLVSLHFLCNSVSPWFFS